jgi:cysteine desulfuration protein SufE
MTIDEKVAQIKEDLQMFPDANQKVEYILDLGKSPTTLPPEKKNDETLVKGCASRAWLTAECKDGKVHFGAEGESPLAKGMIVLLLDIFNDRTPDEILSFDPKKLADIGLMELLSPVRQQGMEAFLNIVYRYAQMCKEQSE